MGSAVCTQLTHSSVTNRTWWFYVTADCFLADSQPVGHKEAVFWGVFLQRWLDSGYAVTKKRKPIIYIPSPFVQSNCLAP